MLSIDKHASLFCESFNDTKKKSFTALKNQELEKGIILPAMETFDPQSVFFLSYAQSLCSHETDLQRDIDRTSSSALINRQKLEGALSQLPEFHHFYFCSHDASLSCGKIIW